MRRESGIFGTIYIVIGLILAYKFGYFANIGTLSGILSALLAVFLWPLVVLGVHLTISV